MALQGCQFRLTTDESRHSTSSVLKSSILKSRVVCSI
jgi:hypothetical protein